MAPRTKNAHVVVPYEDEVIESENESDNDDSEEGSEEEETFPAISAEHFYDESMVSIWCKLIRNNAFRECTLLLTKRKSLLEPKVAFNNWKVFVDDASKINVTMVQHFYASTIENYHRTKYEKWNDLARVRGVDVPFGQADIRKCLNLPRQPSCEYSSIASKTEWHVDKAELTELLCVANSKWDANETKLRHRDLKDEAYYWYEWVRTRLMPTTNTTSVSRIRALLVYAIMTKLKIDVVQIIYDKLREFIIKLSKGIFKKKKSKRPLMFPALITRLCEIKGVEIGADDDIVSLGPGVEYGKRKKAPQATAGSKRARVTREASSSSAPPLGPEVVQQSQIDAFRDEIEILRDAVRADQSAQSLFRAEVRARLHHLEHSIIPFLARYVRDLMIFRDESQGLQAPRYPFPGVFPPFPGIPGEPRDGQED